MLAWVLERADIRSGMPVLDSGCGNGGYLARLEAAGAWSVGLDVSLGILPAAAESVLVNADATRLPFSAGAFDAVLAAHMLYHVADLSAAVAEMRRVLTPGGVGLAVTPPVPPL